MRRASPQCKAAQTNLGRRNRGGGAVASLAPAQAVNGTRGASMLEQLAACLPTSPSSPLHRGIGSCQCGGRAWHCQSGGLACADGRRKLVLRRMRRGSPPDSRNCPVCDTLFAAWQPNAITHRVDGAASFEARCDPRRHYPSGGRPAAAPCPLAAASSSPVDNSLVTASEGSMLRLVVKAAAALADVPPQQQPWAAQLHSFRAVGLTVNPLHMDEISPDGAQQAALHLHLARVEQETPAHTRLRRYICDVRPECCSPEGIGRPPYVTEVRERRCRRGLTELRAGMLWGAEEHGPHWHAT